MKIPKTENHKTRKNIILLIIGLGIFLVGALFVLIYVNKFWAKNVKFVEYDIASISSPMKSDKNIYNCRIYLMNNGVINQYVADGIGVVDDIYGNNFFNRLFGIPTKFDPTKLTLEINGDELITKNYIISDSEPTVIKYLITNNSEGSIQATISDDSFKDAYLLNIFVIDKSTGLGHRIVQFNQTNPVSNAIAVESIACK